MLSSRKCHYSIQFEKKHAKHDLLMYKTSKIHFKDQGYREGTIDTSYFNPFTKNLC